MYIKIDSLNIYYEKYGSKKQSILILPGWGDNRKTFYYLINHLKEYFTIYILDYPGFGNSSINKDLNIFDYTDIVYKFIKSLNLNNTILIGHSFGGRIISILTTKYKINIKKILLMDVAGLKEFNLKTFIKKRIYKFLKIIKYILPEKIRLKYQNYLFQKFASNDYKVLDQKLYKTFQNIIKYDLSNYYKKINLETLILWGENDNITSFKTGLKINKLISNSTLIKIDKTKHFPYLEKPYLVSKIIFEYLKKDIIL